MHKTSKEGLISAKNNLMCKLKWINFNHACNLFLLGNDKALPKPQKTKIRSLVSYLNFLIKVSRTTQMKLFITFLVMN